MESLREHMLSGEQHPGCIKCYQNEAASGWSMRKDFNRIHGRLVDHDLTYLEINFGNLCNLKCRMCGSWGSSRWIADEIKLGWTPSPLVRRTLDDIHVDFAQLTRIKFIGGEVSLEQDSMREIFLRILRARNDLKHLEVEIITNGTVPLAGDILSMLSACNRVMMTVSMDGIGAWNDYQRTGSTWSDIAETAKRYYEFTSPNWQLIITSCVTIYTIGGITQLIDWVTSELPMAKHIVQSAFDPEELILRNLPQSYKNIMIDQLTQWAPAPRETLPDWLPYKMHEFETVRQALIWHIQQDPTCSLDEVKSRLDLLDSVRDDRLSEQNTELFAHLFG